MNIKLSYKGDEEFVGLNENGNEVNVDMRSPELKAHMSPTELLLSGLAACASVEVVAMVKKRRKEFVDLHVEVDGTRREEHPRGFTDIHLKFLITSPDLSEEEAERIVHLSATKYCSVAGSLSANQTHSFEIIRP